MNKIKIGDKFNKLTLLKRYEVKLVKMKRTHYGLFECECGTQKMMLIHNVKHGNSKSCGCNHKDKSYLKGIKKNRPTGLKYNKYVRN